MNHTERDIKVRATLRAEESTILTGWVVGNSSPARGTMLQLELTGGDTVWILQSQWRVETNEWREL